MNREIKFRAWDKTHKRMNYKVQVGNTDYADKNYTCNSIWVDYGDIKSVGWMNADDKCIDLMQFTGLKDKNGKEIYEGDIVKVTKSEGYKIKPIEDIFEVKIEEGVCNASTDWIEASFQWGVAEDDSCEVLSIEVLGNIYENTELFK